MFTLKTGQATNYIDSDVTLLAVPFEIINDEGRTVHAMSQSFPLNSSADEIREVLERHLSVYTDDSNRYEAGKAQQEVLDASAAVVEEISNLTL
jgi:hypothetical protein